MIKKRALGKTGLQVSPLGLGTVKFGRNEKVKYPHVFDLPDETQLANLIALAKEQGINLIDTAPSYGLAEQRLGRLLAGQRHDWVIAGKAGETFANGQSHYDFAPDAITASVEQSLRDLQTDYLDILLLHATQNDLALVEDQSLLQCLQQLKQSGKVRAIGISTVSVEAGLAAADIMDVLMVGYNSDWRVEEPVIAKAKTAQCAVIVKKALNSGHAISAEDALRFCFSNEGVDAAIVGTINPQHLQNNIDAARRFFA